MPSTTEPSHPNPPISEIIPALFIGNERSSYNVDVFREHQIKSVLSVNDAPLNLWGRERVTAIIIQGRHVKIPCLDSSYRDILIHLRRACDFIETSLAHGGFLVHCEKGISRSTAFVIAYLMRKDRRSRDEVLADVKSKRKVRPSENFMTQLDLWGRMEHDVWENREGKVPKAPYAKLLKEKDLTAVLKNSGEFMFEC